MLRIAEYNKVTGEKIELKELEQFGFENDETSNNVPSDFWDDEKDYHFENRYFKCVAPGRRGQDYYLLVNKETRILSIYSTKPDGSGTSGKLDNTLFDMTKYGFIEKVND